LPSEEKECLKKRGCGKVGGVGSVKRRGKREKKEERKMGTRRK
jgi:hypothetical protein